MTEENKESNEEVVEKRESYLEQVAKKKAEMDEALAEADRLVEALKEIKAEEILSGTSAGGKQEETKKEISPKDYAKAALQGKVLDID